jgi:hypothetical protein
MSSENKDVIAVADDVEPRIVVSIDTRWHIRSWARSGFFLDLDQVAGACELFVVLDLAPVLLSPTFF